MRTRSHAFRSTARAQKSPLSPEALELLAVVLLHHRAELGHAPLRDQVLQPRLEADGTGASQDSAYMGLGPSSREDSPATNMLILSAL